MNQNRTQAPLLIAMAGLPGTGKSAIAAELAKRLQGLVLNKDEVRTRLFSREDIEYSREQDDFCMEVIYLMAEYIAKAHPLQTVIIDGRTFSRSCQVNRFLAKAGHMQARPVIIECRCKEECAIRRIERDRRTAAHPAGNRSALLYGDLRKNAEPLLVDHLVIDTGRESLEQSVERCLHYVHTGKF